MKKPNAISKATIDRLPLYFRTLRLLQDVGTRLPEPGAQWAEALSPREQEVARFAAMGDSNAEIAERLSISERTVRAHLSAIFEKLQVSDRLMLALKVHGIGKGQAA